VVFLASNVRPPRGGGDERLLRLALDGDAAGIHLAGGGDLELLSALVPLAIRLGAPVSSLTLPLPERPLAAGRRLPRLGATARDEREAAIALARQALEIAGPAAVRFAVVDFGDVTLSAGPGDLARGFARREMDDGEPGERALAAAAAERRARAEVFLDACRWALELLVRAAERAGMTLALPVAATPWQIPSPREAGLLLGAFAGAPLGLLWDPGRLSVLAALGLAISDDRLRALAAGAVLALENDAVGIEAGYLPGLGERDARVAALTTEATVPHIVTGRPDATDTEIAAALRRVRRD
jgi:hypothetical protein